MDHVHIMRRTEVIHEEGWEGQKKAKGSGSDGGSAEANNVKMKGEDFV